MGRFHRAFSALEDQLKEPPGNFRAWIRLVFSVLLFSLAWAFLVGVLLRWVAPAGSIGQHVKIWDDFFQAAGKEELTFRWFPLFFIMLFSRAKPIRLMLVCAWFASICFGLAHVPNYAPAVGLGWAVLFSSADPGSAGVRLEFGFYQVFHEDRHISDRPASDDDCNPFFV
ncbi:MAG: hypothetical protein Q8L24_01895 [bacterium]|nr:hypothetical protein [bacterium]